MEEVETWINMSKRLKDAKPGPTDGDDTEKTTENNINNFKSNAELFYMQPVKLSDDNNKGDDNYYKRSNTK